MINIPASSYTIEPKESYDNVTIYQNGGYKVFEYKIKNYTPTSPGDLSVEFNALGKKVLANISVQDESKTRAVAIDFEGQYTSNIESTDENKVVLRVTNFSNTDLTNLNLSNAIRISGVEGISVKPDQNTDVSIQQGQTVNLVYKLQGTPITAGTLTASFITNEKIAGYVSNNIQIAPLNDIIEINTLEIEGTYVESTELQKDNIVTVQVHNKNNSKVIKNLDLSEALTFNAGSNVSAVPGQNTNVVLNPGQTLTITYALQGNPAGSNLTAIFKIVPYRIEKQTRILTHLNVFPLLITSETPNTTDNYQITVRAGEGNSWIVQNSNTLPSWLKLDKTSGVGDDVIQVTFNTHTIEVTKSASIIFERTSDKAIAKVINIKPATDEISIISSNPQEITFSINGENKDIAITGNTQNTQLKIIQKPYWVNSILLNDKPGKLTINTIQRTDPGPNLKETLTFSYGPNNSYFFTTNIFIKQKAQKCPESIPLSAKLPAYVVSKQRLRNNYIEPILLESYDETAYDFSNLLFGRLITDKRYTTKTVYTNNKSIFYLDLSGYPSYRPGLVYEKNIWENTSFLVYSRYDKKWNKQYEISFYEQGILRDQFQLEALKKYQMPYYDKEGQSHQGYIHTIPDYVKIKGCVCIDGLDENTPQDGI